MASRLPIVVDPDTYSTCRAGRVAALVAKHTLHLVSVVGAEVERQELEEPTEPALAAHASRALGMSFLARAIPSAVSMRAASARATSRPNGVSR